MNHLREFTKIILLIVLAVIPAVILALILSGRGCQPDKEEPADAVPVPGPSLIRLEAAQYPEFRDDDQYLNLETAVSSSLVYLNKVPKDRLYSYGEDVYPAAHVIASLEIFLSFIRSRPSPAALNEFIRSDFAVYRARGNDAGQTLYTGYYEPTYPGSLEKTVEYPYPLYSIPDDILQIDLALFSEKYKGHPRLVARVNESRRVVPYFSREEINAIADFEIRATPLVWLKSRVDRFFLEIQGSGRVDLGQGEPLRVHYVMSNGNPYRSVGRYLIDNNEILKKDMSMQAIRAWLEKNPHRMDEVLHYNKSFVFFKTETGGPYGSLGVELTPFRSVATDSKLFPRAGLCFVQSALPSRDVMEAHEDWKAYTGFMMNQDTGGAIKGTARADIFCGNDDYAEFTAGHMNTYGTLYFLVLRKNH